MVGACPNFSLNSLAISANLVFKRGCSLSTSTPGPTFTTFLSSALDSELEAAFVSPLLVFAVELSLSGTIPVFVNAAVAV